MHDLCDIKAYARLKLRGGETIELPLLLEQERDGFLLTLPKESIPRETEEIDFIPDEYTATAGEKGYIVMPHTTHNGADFLCKYRARGDGEFLSGFAIVPFFGMLTPRGCFAAILRGMVYDYTFVIDVKGGKYRAFARFLPDGEITVSPSVKYVFLSGEDADYSGMARAYRSYRLSEGYVKPLAERVKENKALAYASQAPEIRIRLAWKPVPSPVLEQTLENEPPIKVAADFERVGEFVEELHRRGVKRAEICLVGWNKSGHDGRYPQIFPVEPLLGGEEKLRKLIQRTQELGYSIVCHTNSTDCYSISEDWNPDITVKEKDGTPKIEGTWGAGRAYKLCPVKAYEFAKRDLPRVAELGFRGLHYIDVIALVPPVRCYSGNHPVTCEESAGYAEKTIALARESVGGFQSEGAFDFLAPVTDYGLYISFNVMGKQHAYCDEVIPLWQLVYHGIILSNPSSETVNYTIKSKDEILKFIEYGGRPSFYIYSRFVDESASRKNWMGTNDLRLGDSGELDCTVGAVKAGEEEYISLERTIYAFMDKHEKLSEALVRVCYSNGDEIICNYGEEPAEYKGRKISAKGYSYIKAE